MNENRWNAFTSKELTYITGGLYHFFGAQKLFREVVTEMEQRKLITPEEQKHLVTYFGELGKEEPGFWDRDGYYLEF